MFVRSGLLQRIERAGGDGDARYTEYEPECVPMTLRCALLVTVADERPAHHRVRRAPDDRDRLRPVPARMRRQDDSLRLLAALCLTSSSARRALTTSSWRRAESAHRGGDLLQLAPELDGARPGDVAVAEASNPCVPPNENGSRGTGTPTLTPTMPLVARSATCARDRAARREDAGRVAVRAGAVEREGLVERVDAHDGEHGAEELRRRAFHVRSRLVEHHHDVSSPDGLVRVENTRSWITVGQLGEWCTDSGTRVKIQPVLDLNEHLHTDAYKPTPWLREQVTETHPTCVFPHCTRPSRSCDLDRIIEWPPARPTASTWRRSAGDTTATRPTAAGPTNASAPPPSCGEARSARRHLRRG